MCGAVEEAQHEIEEHEKGLILDHDIVACMHREHYEIAENRNDIALAEAPEEKEVADLMTETLEEEKETDLKLTEVTKAHIMREAMSKTGKEGSSRGRVFH
jgi:ferritin-like metal-binding protein YciE